MSDGNSPLLQRATSSRRSSATLSSSASTSSFQHAQHAGYSPPPSPGPKDVRIHSILQTISISLYTHVSLIHCFGKQWPSDNCYVYTCPFAFPDTKGEASKTVSLGHSTEDEGGSAYTTDGTLLHLHVLLQERASHINTFIYVKIPQTTLCITYKVNCVTYTCIHTT